MSEKRMKAGFGQTVVVGYSEPVHSSQFGTFDQFADKVQQEWDHQWKRVYSARLQGDRTVSLIFVDMTPKHSIL